MRRQTAQRGLHGLARRGSGNTAHEMNAAAHGPKHYHRDRGRRKPRALGPVG
jgi:hypothetical protein